MKATEESISSAVRLEAMAEKAARMAVTSVPLEEWADFERQLDLFANELFDRYPPDDAQIGFDRPTTVYVISQMSQFSVFGQILGAMIESRPWERHVVLFTFRPEDIRVLQKRIRGFGGGAIAPDASLGLFDRWLWLHAKLSAYAGQRLIFLAEPADVVARIGARSMASRYGKRLYFWLGQVALCPAGSTLEKATFLCGDPAVKRAAKQANPAIRVGTVHAPFKPERDWQEIALPALPAPPGLGRRAYVRWQLAVQKWRIRHLAARIRRLVGRSVLAGAIWQGRILLARAGSLVSPGDFVTATAGQEADFTGSGPMSFGAIIADRLKATTGVHLHVGPVSPSFQYNAKKTLAKAGLDAERLVFQPDGSSVALAFCQRRIDLFMGSFPTDHPVNRAQATWAGLAQAFFHQDRDPAAPPGALLWTSAAELVAGLTGYKRAGIFPRIVGQWQTWRWSAHRFSPKRLKRRFAAIIATCEGNLDRPVTDKDRQIARQMFAAATGGDQRRQSTLFNAQYYLDSLPLPARKIAADDPLAHYLLRGERLGHRPHPLFDPAICTQSFSTLDQPLATSELATGPAFGSVLGQYIAAGGFAMPHMFFDARHYARQLASPPRNRSLLEDFLIDGAKEGLRPHPLIEPEHLSPKKAAGFLADFLTWLRGGFGQERQPHLLFDAGHFRKADAPERLNAMAPVPLWGHLIEGNLRHCDPHIAISAAHIEKARPGMLVQATTAVELIARNQLGKADTHPLIDCALIARQAPWAAQQGKHPLRYFMERGSAENIDPHPWFSTQFYLFHNPDVFRSGMNPLQHYLRYGQHEYRRPSAFFNGHQYYFKYIQAEGGDEGALVDYVLRGAGLFWNALWVDEPVKRLTNQSALALFDQECSTADRLEPVKLNSPAARMLYSVVHPDGSGPHPTLVTEKRVLLTTTPQDGTSALERRVFAPARIVTVLRPAIVAPVHIAAPAGNYKATEIDAALYPDAELVAGNDGFILRSGEWLDHGLAVFDPEISEAKGNAAVASIGKGHVLLRRYALGQNIPSGIFASGSYSKNYYHFLVETLPRILFAAEIAPPGTPIMADDDMPAQHYQAMRLYLPDNPILRLARHRTYKVARLYAASMPNIFQDAFRKSEVPHDAVRLHPAALGKVAALSKLVCPPVPEAQSSAPTLPKRLFLRRDSKWRKLLNSEEIEKALVDRGFTPVEFAKLPFADQVRYMENADVVVAQSSAHLANILFARPQCKVYALFSNAPGSNYNLWSALGAAIGVDVVNIVGWRVPGSTGGAAPEAHEHFTVPLPQITAFFPTRHKVADIGDILKALHGAGAEANAITSAWALRAEQTPEQFQARLIDLRRRALAGLRTASEDTLEDLATNIFFTDPWASLTSGLRALADHDRAECAAIDEITQAFQRLSTGEQSLSDNAMRRLLLQAVLLVPAWRMPLIADPGLLPSDMRDLYLRWVTAQPFLFRKGDDAAYVAHVVRLLDWFDRNIADDRPETLRRQMARTAANLDLGQLLLIEAPLTEVFSARNRLLERIAIRQGRPRAHQRPSDGSAGRLRIGIMCRTFEKGPDSEAVVSIFRAFDLKKYEIFAYSVGFRDRVVTSDSTFDREFDLAIEHRRLLPADAAGQRAQILKDDLDVFLFANATTYGIHEQELALYHPVAPVQAVMNSHVPVPLGFASFAGYITGLSDHPDHDVAQNDFPERLIRIKGPVISFLSSFKPRPNPPLDRKALGLSPDDIVMMNAGSFQKLRHECLVTMMRAVRDVPGGILVLAPYNPGWAARSQAFPFNVQLAETASEVGLDLSRIRVLSELTVAEAEASLACADVYLNPFPHGGATMTHLALIYGIPPVTLRRRSTRSIDQFLIESLGFPELLADTPDEYVALARDLAVNPARRKKIARDLRLAARHPVFVGNADYSRDMQAAIEELLASV